MKRNLLLLSLLLAVVGNTAAQEELSLIRFANEWVVYNNAEDKSCFLKGTTTINGQTYRVERDGIYCYRQNGKKVYRCTIADGKEQLVLDFGLQVGETFSLCENFSLQVESVSDTLIASGWGEELLCKRLCLKGVEQPSFQDVWIEKFGSVCYGINPPTKAEDFSQTDLMYAVSGGFYYLADFSREGVWGMAPMLGEEYPKYIESDPLMFTLKDGALHIGGYIRNDCAGPLYLLVEEKSEKIILTTYELPEDADCYSYFKIDVTIPGLTQDKYTIHYGGREIVVTQGSASVDDIERESIDAAYYDLMGRKVAHPTRGIYIKDGRKVVF